MMLCAQLWEQTQGSETQTSSTVSRWKWSWGEQGVDKKRKEHSYRDGEWNVEGKNGMLRKRMAEITKMVPIMILDLGKAVDGQGCQNERVGLKSYRTQPFPPKQGPMEASNMNLHFSMIVLLL